MESGNTWILLFQEQWQVPAASGKEALPARWELPSVVTHSTLPLREGARSFSPTGSSLGQAGETAEPLKATEGTGGSWRS